MDIFNLWDLHSPEKIASTHTSDVYKANKSGKIVVLKCLNDNGKVCEKQSPYALKAFNGQGSVKLIEYNDDAILMEFVDGKKLSEMVKGVMITWPWRS